MKRFKFNKKRSRNKAPIKAKLAAVVDGDGAGPLATYISIDRPVLHIGKGGSFYRTKFPDLDGNARTEDIPRKFFTPPTEAISFLLNAHAKLPMSRDDQKQCIADAIAAIGTKPTLKITDRVGWDNGTGGARSFVFYGRTFGAAHDTLQLDQDGNRNPALGKKSGSVTAWRKGLTEPCQYSDHIVLAISIAASGPLYGLIGNPEPCIYHFQGAIKPAGDTRSWKSSSGKTMSARCAQSVFGACSISDLFGFNMTQLALEESCFSCNNLAIVLDEQGTAGEGGGANSIDPKKLPYRIVGGQGRRRSKHYSSSQGAANNSWVVPVITTAEDELDSSTSKRKEGAQVRMVPIPFPATWEGGTFIRASKPSKRNRLAAQVESTITANYGVAMPEYIRQLVKNRPKLAADVLKMRDGFIKDVTATSVSWDKRFAEKFGILLAAALLLVRYGIAPWTEERAVEAVKNLYTASRALNVSVPEATDALLKKLQKLVAAGKRFRKLAKGQSLKPSLRKVVWGVVRDIGGKNNVTMLTMARLRKLVQPSAVSDLVLDELASRGLLVKDSGGLLTRQVLIKGFAKKRARYVCIKGLVAKKRKPRFGGR